MHKLAPKWTGPAYIVEKFNPSKYKVKLVGKNKCYDVHVNNIYSRNDQMCTPEEIQEGHQVVPKTPQVVHSAPRNLHAMETRSKAVYNSWKYEK